MPLANQSVSLRLNNPAMMTLRLLLLSFISPPNSSLVSIAERGSASGKKAKMNGDVHSEAQWDRLCRFFTSCGSLVGSGLTWWRASDKTGNTLEPAHLALSPFAMSAMTGNSEGVVRKVSDCAFCLMFGRI